MIKRTTTFLMANLGSAVMRVYSSHEKKDKESSKLYSQECFKIINQIISNKDSVGGMKEALIIKSIISNLENYSSKNLNINKKEIESYFLPFSILVTQQNNK